MSLFCGYKQVRHTKYAESWELAGFEHLTIFCFPSFITQVLLLKWTHCHLKMYLLLLLQLMVCMHSVNAVFLVGDMILNCMVSFYFLSGSTTLLFVQFPSHWMRIFSSFQRFPFFRIAYFVLWTAAFVIFQWIIHACVSMW